MRSSPVRMSRITVSLAVAGAMAVLGLPALASPTAAAPAAPRGPAALDTREASPKANLPVYDAAGRKIADSLWAIYASRQYIERHGAPATVADLARHPLIAFEESMSKHRIMSWFKEVAPHATYAARNTSILGLISAAKAGVGVAPLPMALGDVEADLVRVLGPVPELTRAWRILTHPDQRHTARIAAFFEFVLNESEALHPILTG